MRKRIPSAAGIRLSAWLIALHFRCWWPWFLPEVSGLVQIRLSQLNYTRSFRERILRCLHATPIEFPFLPLCHFLFCPLFLSWRFLWTACASYFRLIRNSGHGDVGRPSNQSINQSIAETTHQSNDQSMNQSTNQYINKSMESFWAPWKIFLIFGMIEFERTFSILFQVWPIKSVEFFPLWRWPSSSLHCWPVWCFSRRASILRRGTMS